MENFIGPLVFLIVGGGFLYVGFYIHKKNSRIRANGTKTKAKIIDYKEELIKNADGVSQTYHFPIVRFTDRIGNETIQKLDSSEPPKKINAYIDIIYLKKDDDYEIIRDNDWWEQNLPRFCLGFGILFFGIGIVWGINKI